jgi:hypothetical protein
VVPVALILGVEHRLHDVRRDLVEGDGQAVLLGVEGGQDAAVAGVDDRAGGKRLEVDGVARAGGAGGKQVA